MMAGFRAKHLDVSLGTLCGQLNWRGDTPIAHLCGGLPIVSDGFDKLTRLPVYDFSARVEPLSKVNRNTHHRLPRADLGALVKQGKRNPVLFAQQAVLRSSDDQTIRDVWGVVDRSAYGLQEPLLSKSYCFFMRS